MTKDELISKLKLLYASDDTETMHLRADHLLIEFIDDEEIEKAYRGIEKWYS